MKYLAFVLLLLCPRVWGDDLLECTDRGRIALDTARAIMEGFPVEGIQYNFPFATEKDMPLVEKWAEDLKKEVVQALKEKGTPELAAQQIIERCAYEYGKKRLKKTGSTEIDRKQQYCYSYIHQLREIFKEVKTSSGEAVLKKHPPEQEGYDRERAEKLIKEIENTELMMPWLEEKWNTCLKESAI